jgi:rhomboid protease GluP
MREPVDQHDFVERLYAATPTTWVTTLIVAANLVVWGLNLLSGMSVLSPHPQELLAWGGNFLPATREQPWRLFTAMFLHGGLIHLALNMWALWDVGRLVERFYGNTQMILIYLICGLAGSLCSLFFAASRSVSIGASGAIFGVVGCLLAALYTKPNKLPAGLVRTLRSSMLGFVGYSLIMGFVVGFIDNAAHIGGLVAGWLMGVVLAERFDADEYRRQAGVRLAIALCTALGLLVLIWSWLPPRIR